MEQGDATDLREEEVRKAIWLGAIPIVFTITPNEITNLNSPDPYYLLVPRDTYLPLVTGPVKEHFSLSNVPVNSDEMWLKYKETAIKWQYPIGVLFDLLGNPDELPWPITVSFQGLPTGNIMRYPDAPTLKSIYMNSVKEANFLKFGDVRKVIDLSAEEQNNLWEGLISNDYDKFWEVNNKLIPDKHEFKSLAIRIIRSKDTKPIIQEPITDSGPERKTLGDVLSQLLPELFPSKSEPSDRAVAIIQGISPPLNTPITWLTEHCSHPDNFLYLIVREKK